jgi:hypothetical protein
MPPEKEVVEATHGRYARLSCSHVVLFDSKPRLDMEVECPVCHPPKWITDKLPKEADYVWGS